MRFTSPESLGRHLKVTSGYPPEALNVLWLAHERHLRHQAGETCPPDTCPSCKRQSTAQPA